MELKALQERLDELEANMTDARNRIATLETNGDPVARQAAADAQSASTTNAERIDELQSAVIALQAKLAGVPDDVPPSIVVHGDLHLGQLGQVGQRGQPGQLGTHATNGSQPGQWLLRGPGVGVTAV